MLVLTRKPGEKIQVIDEHGRIQTITIVVVGIDRNKVRIGIEAQSDLTILRTELIPEERNDEPGQATEEGRG